MIETYKIIIDVYDIPKELFFEFNTAGRRAHERKLFKKRFRLDIRKFTFSNRVIDNRNSLPDCCANADTSINCFKRHVSVALEPETV